MSQWTNTTVIINPASAAGRTGRRFREITKAIGKYLGNGCSVHTTSRPLEAQYLARSAALAGCHLIVVVGGDGTVSETVNGLFENGRLVNQECELGIISSGTGEGLARSMRLPLRVEEALRAIVNGDTRAIDVGRISFRDQRARERERYFVSECQFGIGAEVVRRAINGRKRLGGALAYGLTTLSVALSYQNRKMTVEIDGVQRITRLLLGGSVGNGDCTAGGMHLTPVAKPDDGTLDLLLMHEASIVQRLRSFPKIYSGRHLESEGFSYYSAKSISLLSDVNVPVAADGELVGSLPCTIEVLPASLLVRCPQPQKEENHASVIAELAEI